MKRFLLFVLLLQFIVGSSCTNMCRDQYGRVLPRYPRWSLKEKAGDPHGILRYDVVYVRRSEDRYHPGYQVVRFWPTGHYMSKLVNELSLETIDAFDNSAVGYYQVISRDEIIVEIYTTINFGQYAFVLYKLDNNGDLIRLSFGPSRSWWHAAPQKPWRYQPMRIGELKLEPDW